MARRAAACAPVLLFAAACSDASGLPTAPGAGGNGGSHLEAQGGAGGGTTHPPDNECETAGQTQCSGVKVQVCEPRDGVLKWGAALECPNGQACRDGSCQDPTVRQLQQIASLEDYVDQVLDETGWSEPLDGDAIKSASRKLIVEGDESDDAFFRAMRLAHLAVPEGHQALLAKDGCGTPELPSAYTSRYGVCTRPVADGVIVTAAKPGNPLNLSAGDRITAIDGMTGPAFLDVAAQHPLCTSSSPSPGYRRTEAAASLFATVASGAELSVVRVDGSTAIVTVPEHDEGATTSCNDPLGRDMNFIASSSVREDGIGVIRLARFYPVNAPSEIGAIIEQVRDAVQEAFNAVKDAPMLIWDARSNGGGLTGIGLSIAGGMSSAQPTPISYCQFRIPGTFPPTYYPEHYAKYEVTPGGAYSLEGGEEMIPSGTFAYDGKVAVLMDGLDYSAADYFPLALRKATSALLVGSPAAGAFGASGSLIDLAGPPAMVFSTDGNHCLDAATNEPLEGHPVIPDVEVEYAPQDLAVGIDTVEEAAAAALKQM